MNVPDVRRSIAAGKFYPDSARKLTSLLQTLIKPRADKVNARACLMPHAAYPYSGKIAGDTISRVILPKIAVLLGPNHSGYGSRFGLLIRGSWETPLGEVAINEILARQLIRTNYYFEEDIVSHRSEHSLEVIVPFLQFLKPDISIVPVLFNERSLPALIKAGEAIAETIASLAMTDKCVIIASSDLTHYEPQLEAERKDKEALQAIRELDEEKLFKTVEQLQISMCGWAPVICAISAAKKMGARNADLTGYQTSGDTTKDKNSVVGYGGAVIY